MDPAAGSWTDLLPYQSLEFQTPARLAPSTRPKPQSQPYVQHLAAGGWPDINDVSVVRDARGERELTKAMDNRTTLVTSPLSDRDGYVGAAPPGTGLTLPPVAQPAELSGGAQPQPRGKPSRKPSTLRGWNPRSWRQA